MIAAIILLSVLCIILADRLMVVQHELRQLKHEIEIGEWVPSYGKPIAGLSAEEYADAMGRVAKELADYTSVPLGSFKFDGDAPIKKITELPPPYERTQEFLDLITTGRAEIRPPIKMTAYGLAAHYRGEEIPFPDEDVDKLYYEPIELPPKSTSSLTAKCADSLLPTNPKGLNTMTSRITIISQPDNTKLVHVDLRDAEFNHRTTLKPGEPVNLTVDDEKDIRVSESDMLMLHSHDTVPMETVIEVKEMFNNEVVVDAEFDPNGIPGLSDATG